MGNYYDHEKLGTPSDPLELSEVMELLRRYSLVMEVRHRGNRNGGDYLMLEDVAFIADLGDAERDFALVRIILFGTTDDGDTYAEEVRWQKYDIPGGAADLLADSEAEPYHEDDFDDDDEDDEDFDGEED